MNCCFKSSKRKDSDAHDAALESSKVSLLGTADSLVKDYIEGDADDMGIESLLHSDEAPKLTHPLNLSLPREEWVTKVMHSTPRSSRDPSPHTIITSSTSRSSSSPPLSPAVDDEDMYWRRVARNLINYKLGVHPDRPELVVSEHIPADIIIESTDPQECYTKIFNEIATWAEKHSRREQTRRLSISGKVSLQSHQLTLLERKHSPKMFLDESKCDDELRTFIGFTRAGVPLMRATLLRVRENSVRTNSNTITGLIVVDVNFADQIQCLQNYLTKNLVMDIIDKVGATVDFVRLSKNFAGQYDGVSSGLVLEGYMNQYRGRYIRYGNPNLIAQHRSFSDPGLC